MRVVVNGWFFASLAAGSGQYLDALARWLPRVQESRESRESREFVLLVPAAKAQERPGSPAGWRVQIVSTPFDRRSENLAKVWFEQVVFPHSCRQLRADVAWTPYWGSSWWRPCPVVVTVHDLIPLLLPAYRGSFLQRCYTTLVARTARRASAILTDSQASRHDIVHHLSVPEERVLAVPLAAEWHEAPESAGTRQTDAEVRQRYGIPDDPFLLYLGGFDVRKNLERTLAAYARLMERLENASRRVPKLVIAGRLPEQNTPFAPDPRPIIARLRIDQHVHLTGWVDERDKPALYRQALAVLFLSEYEGFGLPILEAMAAGAVPSAPRAPVA